ncbi:WD repeat-containing protein 34-like [Photinus pyralis]|nr:WD repeat-containing protein 34-like [Photinus pyralis]
MKYYEPHEGEIITVRFSPNRKDMFMSCGTDGEIRIYLTKQESPARVIFVEELYHVSWVPFHEHLITGCGKKGLLEIFHLISGQPIPNVSTDKVLPTSLLQIEVNKQRCTIVAVGNNRGELQLWSVPWGHFSSVNSVE